MIAKKVLEAVNFDDEYNKKINAGKMAKVIFLNMSLKFPAIVISLTGYLNTPFSTINPVAPTE